MQAQYGCIPTKLPSAVIVTDCEIESEMRLPRAMIVADCETGSEVKPSGTVIVTSRPLANQQAEVSIWAATIAPS